MNEQQVQLTHSEMLAFFKALADPNRLKIIGLLVEQDLSGEQLAAMLNLRPSTVSHHLSLLNELGLVRARSESYYNIYELVTDRLDELGKKFLSLGAISSSATSVDLEAYDRKVIRDYMTDEGRLKTIPGQRKKLEAVLRAIIAAFEVGTRYTEKQVNEILGRYHADTATLRRELVGYRLLQRTGNGEEYWRDE